MAKSNFRRGVPPKIRTRTNEQIDAPRVLLIDEDGEKLGEVSLEEALEKAEARQLDLVEVAPDGEPPVCRIQDYKKYLYEQRKKQKDSRKKTKQLELKEIKMRPRISDNDFQMKANRMIKFLRAGHKCKLTIQFNGREIRYKDMGFDIIKRVQETVKDSGLGEGRVSSLGRFLNQIFSPTKEVLLELSKTKKDAPEIDHRHKHEIKEEQRREQERLAKLQQLSGDDAEEKQEQNEEPEVSSEETAEAQSE